MCEILGSVPSTRERKQKTLVDLLYSKEAVSLSK